MNSFTKRTKQNRDKLDSGVQQALQHPESIQQTTGESTRVDRPVPQVKPWFQDGFHRFLNRFLASHFHAIAVERPLDKTDGSDGNFGSDAATLDWLASIDGPLIVYGNHPSWWDPLVAHFLNRRLLSGRQFYAPIDAEALESYQVFGKLGFYGVDQSRAGTIDFLRVSHQILQQPHSALWLTPEGKFSDVRNHENELMAGLSRLCQRRELGCVMPLAVEYAFWDERLPVCLCRFGEPIRFADHLSRPKEQWHEELTHALRQNQTQLAQAVMSRDAGRFVNLIEGNRGAGRLYDTFRRAKSWLTGKPFVPHHGHQFT